MFARDNFDRNVALGSTLSARSRCRRPHAREARTGMAADPRKRGPIPGTSSVDRLGEVAAAVTVRITRDDLAESIAVRQRARSRRSQTTIQVRPVRISVAGSVRSAPQL